MSTAKDRKNRREKCLMDNNRGDDKKKSKSMRRKMKKNEDAEIGDMPSCPMYYSYEHCQCEECKKTREL